MSARNMDAGNNAGADQEQEKKTPVQEEFKSPIELPKGWSQEIYEEFSSLKSYDQIDDFVNLQSEQQKINPDMEVVDGEKLFKMKQELLHKLALELHKMKSKEEQLKEARRELEYSPALMAVRKAKEDIRIKKNGHEMAASVPSAERDKVLSIIKTAEQELRALEEKLASLPELAKPGFLKSKKEYNANLDERANLKRQIGDLKGKIEFKRGDASAYQQGIDHHAEVFKKEIVALEEQQAQAMSSEQHKQDSAKLREVESALEDLGKRLAADKELDGIRQNTLDFINAGVEENRQRKLSPAEKAAETIAKALQKNVDQDLGERFYGDEDGDVVRSFEGGYEDTAEIFPPQLTLEDIREIIEEEDGKSKEALMVERGVDPKTTPPDKLKLYLFGRGFENLATEYRLDDDRMGNQEEYVSGLIEKYTKLWDEAKEKQKKKWR